MRLLRRPLLIPGRCHEEISRRRLRCRRQPDLLQREHRHVARRRQEDLRRTPVQAEGALRTLRDPTATGFRNVFQCLVDHLSLGSID